jgi:PTH1 family peptidyl-tRNA hydrolase
VERFALARGIALKKDNHYQALVARDGALWLVMPQTFMNASGRAVQMLAGFFKIPAEEILVVHDELDFPAGTARIKQGGGIAGHNGLKDISQRLGSHDYWRLRLGVGRPADKDSGADYVLEKPPAEEREAIEGAIARALEVMPQILGGDLQGAMQKLHSQDKPVAAKPEQAKPEAKKPEPPKPEAKKAEAKKPDAKAPEAKKPEAQKAQAPKPEAARPEAQKAEAKKPQPVSAARKEEKTGGLKGFFRGLTGSKK